MFAIFQSAGNIPVEKDLLNNTHNEVDNSSAHSFKIWGEIKSDPGDL